MNDYTQIAQALVDDILSSAHVPTCVDYAEERLRAAHAAGRREGIQAALHAVAIASGALRAEQERSIDRTRSVLLGEQIHGASCAWRAVDELQTEK